MNDDEYHKQITKLNDEIRERSAICAFSASEIVATVQAWLDDQLTDKDAKTALRGLVDEQERIKHELQDLRDTRNKIVQAYCE